MDHSISTFSPERCADLHNRLLAKAIEHSPGTPTERTTATRFLQEFPEFADLPSIEELPLYRFLQLIDNTPAPAADGGPGLLTPFMYQPDPTTFRSDRVGHEPSFVLLYGQHNGDSRLDGGVYLDIRSYHAIWHVAGLSPRFPPADQFVPLHVILRHALDSWEPAGKFYFDPSTSCIATRSWTPRDLRTAVAAWGRLLGSIEARLPAGAEGVGDTERLPPLSVEVLAPVKAGAFAAAFLNSAARPGFSFVAPGTRVFTPASLEAVYGAEAPDSSRRVHWLGESGEGDWPTLILPGLEPVSLDVGHDTDPRISSFDKAWGFGKFTVNRWSGLYVMPDTTHSDLVRYICSSGLCEGSEFRTAYRCGPPREPKLAEVFAHWARLVDNGTWLVDEDGVCTEHSWFDENVAVAKVPPMIGIDW